MTLTELKYIVAVARERHFGRAAESCFVSQPTLSVAVRKLEEELNVSIFERGGCEVGLTPVGSEIVSQAQKVLDEAGRLKDIARKGEDPIAGPLHVGMIYTVAPYLLPSLIATHYKRLPQMPLILQENFTMCLLELLRQGEIDCAVLALPLQEPGIETLPLCTEEFMVAVPASHAWANRDTVSTEELKGETMLLLGSGHCFRDQVLEVCPEMSHFSPSTEGIQKSFEGSSLETIKHMVAAGLGITLLPKTVVAAHMNNQSSPSSSLIKFIPISEPVPNREIVLCWRKSFTRRPAIYALAESIYQCGLPDVTMHPKALDELPGYRIGAPV